MAVQNGVAAHPVGDGVLSHRTIFLPGRPGDWLGDGLFGGGGTSLARTTSPKVTVIRPRLVSITQCEDVRE